MTGTLRHYSRRSLAALRSLAGPALCLLPLWAAAQLPPALPPGGLLQLQIAQPLADVSTSVSASAEFDPPVVAAGGKTFYRVNVTATESSIQWPGQPAAPAALHFGAHASGEVAQMQGNKYRPLAAFLYEVAAPQPGHFTIPAFSVKVAGVPTEIPAASVEVVAQGSGLAPAAKLRLELSATNLYLGQPFHARVILPADPGNQVQAVREIEFHGDSVMMDKTYMRQSIEPVNLDGRLKTAFVFETTVTPLAAGPLKFAAQGFSAGRDFSAPISIHGSVTLAGGAPKYTFLISDPVEIHVRPLPVEGELPGFTGAIGRFFHDPPVLSTNRMRVGEPVRLSVVFHGAGELARLAPPAAPRVRDWQIIADPPPATSFTLVPLGDDQHETPAIPFSYFDPDSGKYVDLSLPPMPVTVVGEGLPLELAESDSEGRPAAPLKLSALAPAPGKAVGSLRPLQLQGWFAAVQLVPVAGWLALWQWDRRRRYWEAHPDLLRRVRARRALQRVRGQLQSAVEAGDGAAFIRLAVQALSIAVAPHLPANPQALVSADVLAQLADTARGGPAGDTVRQVFAAADAHFAITPQTLPDWPGLRPRVDAVLQMLEEKL
jgi:hypothetical protein